jgi:hypothetical protein
MDFLIYHYKQSEIKHAPNAGLLSAINTSWYAFNLWYEQIDKTPAYVTAVLLHPSKRLAALKKGWTTKRWVTAGTARAKALWRTYKEKYTPPIIAEANDCTDEPSAWALYQRSINVIPEDDDDFTAFINAPPTKLAYSITPLQWWSSPQQRECYPALSKLAIDVLSAFSMSAASETVFSCSRRAISWERVCLGGVVVEQSECSKDWQRSGIAYSDAYLVANSDDEDEEDEEDTPTPPSSTFMSL